MMDTVFGLIYQEWEYLQGDMEYGVKRGEKWLGV